MALFWTIKVLLKESEMYLFFTIFANFFVYRVKFLIGRPKHCWKCPISPKLKKLSAISGLDADCIWYNWTRVFQFNFPLKKLFQSTMYFWGQNIMNLWIVGIRTSKNCNKTNIAPYYIVHKHVHKQCLLSIFEIKKSSLPSSFGNCVQEKYFLRLMSQITFRASWMMSFQG